MSTKRQNSVCESQQIIMKQYKKNYPNQTLRQMSEQTGIQFTRLHRIFQGHEMKISEYEVFQKLINASNDEHGEMAPYTSLSYLPPHYTQHIKALHQFEFSINTQKTAE